MNRPVLRLRPSIASLMSSTFTVLTSVLSVILTYSWQGKWRNIERLPFVSDAHYDDIQSPIFTMMATLTAMSTMITVLLTFLVSNDRRCEALDSSDILSNRRLRFPLHTSNRVEHLLITLGLIAGLTGSLLLAVAAACSSKLSLHFVAISLSFSCSILWACAVSLTLRAHHARESGIEILNSAGMQVCVLLLFGAVTGLVVLHPTNLLAAVMMEYIVIVLLVIFFLLLSFRLRGSVVYVRVLAHDYAIPTDNIAPPQTRLTADDTLISA